MSTRGLQAELVERLVHGPGARMLSEEAVVAMMFVARRQGSRVDGLALADDAAAYQWICRACTGTGSNQQGQQTVTEVRHRGARAVYRGEN